MKNFKTTTLFLALLFTGLFTSCTNDDASDAVGTEEIRSSATMGEWRLTQLVDSGIDETQEFVNYTFIFSDNGTVSARSEANTVTGRWSVVNDRDRDDQMDDLEFIIEFNVPESSIFDDLDEDWDILTVSDTKIALVDDDDDNEPSDLLTFERN